jgi:hypothetical protein
MTWLAIFIFLSLATAVGLLLPGAVMWCIPATSETGEWYLSTGRGVAMIATLVSPILSFFALQLAAGSLG